jgi:putative flippase GtrA
VSFVVNLNRRFVRIAHEFAKFGSVGAIAFVITIALGNALHTGLAMGPLTSNGIATTIATTFAYFANRHWTFRHRDRTGLGREYALFFGLNGIGLAMTELFIGFTHYVLGQHGAIAYNFSLIVGTGFATLFRFWSYKKWVFPPAAAPGTGLAAALPGGSPDAGGSPGRPEGDHVPADHVVRADNAGVQGHRPPARAPEHGPAAEPGQTEVRQVTRAR